MQDGGMMHKEEGRDKVDDDQKRCWTGKNASNYKDRANAIGQKSKRQAGMCSDMNGVGEMLNHR